MLPPSCCSAKPWQLDELGDITLAFPCATQNELDEDDAEALHSRGCRAVIEGANMPTTAAAVERLESHDMLYIPGKMANAGGVAVSGLEMAQNRAMDTWEAHDVHEKLRGIMQDVYRQAKENEEKYNCGLGAGANIAAFLKVAEALQAQGAV